MEIVNPQIEAYIVENTSPESVLLYDLNRRTHIEQRQSNMLSGKVQARFLSMVSHMVKPKYILEIGTFTGYSALCLAEGLQKGGKLVTIDNNEELITKNKILFADSAFGHQIEQICGEALEVIPQLEYDFDLVFIDADKLNYSNYYELLVNKLKSNTFLLVDNVLWKGLVTQSTTTDKITQAMKSFNAQVNNDPRVENVILSLRDGLSLIRVL